MRHKEFEIRSLVGEDIPLVSSMITRCVSESCRTAYDSDGLKYWTSLYSKKKFCEYTKGWDFWVLCGESDKILGCVGLNKNELRGLFVEPEYQGAGIGKKLLEFAESYAKKKGAKKISLDASPNAVRFYEKNGYVVLGTKRYATNLQKGVLEVIMMEKEIAG